MTILANHSFVESKLSRVESRAGFGLRIGNQLSLVMHVLACLEERNKTLVQAMSCKWKKDGGLSV